MPNSRFALHGKRHSLIHDLCAIFASNSRFVRVSQATLDTCLDSPFFASLSVHGLHFTLYAPSKKYLGNSCAIAILAGTGECQKPCDSTLVKDQKRKSTL